MKSQYCKVGAVTPIGNDPTALDALQLRYQLFLEKANLTDIDARLAEFFESKAESFKKIIESL